MNRLNTCIVYDRSDYREDGRLLTFSLIRCCTDFMYSAILFMRNRFSQQIMCEIRFTISIIVPYGIVNTELQIIPLLGVHFLGYLKNRIPCLLTVKICISNLIVLFDEINSISSINMIFV